MWDLSGPKIFLILLLSCLIYKSECQTVKADLSVSVPDSVMEKKHSPTKATIMSALLPGLGQVYNRKYWKGPIIYVGFGILTYFIIYNSHEYYVYKGAYKEKVDSVYDGQYPDLVKNYSADDLLSGREYYQRNLEISCLLTGVLYILNIVDAAVDAHLFTYNINQDLSLKVEPVMIGPVYSQRVSSGIKVSIKF
jgi:TM2 domain-containing membrane protein YozV